MTERTSETRADAASPVFRVVAGSPTDAELAAVTAVLLASLRASAARAAAAPARAPHPSAWQRSQRALRGTHTPGAGRWRGFSA